MSVTCRLSDWKYPKLSQQVPHDFQEVMSADSTPILCGAVPSFELFMTRWEMMAKDFPKLKKYVEPGLKCAYDYYGRMDHTRAYIITMRKRLHLPALGNPTNCYLQS